LVIVRVIALHCSLSITPNASLKKYAVVLFIAMILIVGVTLNNQRRAYFIMQNTCYHCQKSYESDNQKSKLCSPTCIFLRKKKKPKEKHWSKGRENQIFRQHWLAWEINNYNHFPDWSNALPCGNCNKWFTTNNNKSNRFCSNDCSHLFKVKRWIKCSKCHALIGMTTKQSGLMLNLSGSAVADQWRKFNITTQKQHVQGWVALRKKNETESVKIEKQKETLPDVIHKRLWMREIRSHRKFPDWSYLWVKEKSKKKENQSYYNANSYYERACYADAMMHGRRSIYPDWSSVWHKSRMSLTPQRRSIANMRTRLKQIMKNTKLGGTFSKSSLLGCSTRDFAKHLENNFTKCMTWDNYGSHWHVDHIIPCSAFDHADKKQIAQCWHFTNLRPLAASANIAKSDTITEPQMHLLL